MNPAGRAVKDLIDRHLKWPSELAYMAARDRVRETLLSTPSHLQTPRIADAPPIPAWRMTTAAAAAAVVALAVGVAMLWPRGPQHFTAGATGTQVTLDDGSQIEMRATAELTVERDQHVPIAARLEREQADAHREREGEQQETEQPRGRSDYAWSQRSQRPAPPRPVPGDTDAA